MSSGHSLDTALIPRVFEFYTARVLYPVMALSTPQLDLLRSEFNDLLKRQPFNVLTKDQYDEIIEHLRGGVLLDNDQRRRQRNARSRYILIENTDGIKLVWRKRDTSTDASSLDLKRLVHSEEVFDIISSAHRDYQLNSAKQVHLYLSERYLNISLKLCYAYFRCCNVANPPSRGSFREGFFSLVDMTPMADVGSQWNYALLYQDFPAQGIYARELRYASAAAVARELTKLFFYLGPPEHLYASDIRRTFVRKVLRHVSSNMSHDIQITKGRYFKHQVYNLTEFKTRLIAWIDENIAFHWRFGIHACAGHLTRNPMDLNNTRFFREPPVLSEIESMVQDALLVISRANGPPSSGSEDVDFFNVDENANRGTASIVTPADSSLADMSGDQALPQDQGDYSHANIDAASIATPADSSLADVSGNQALPQHQEHLLSKCKCMSFKYSIIMYIYSSCP